MRAPVQLDQRLRAGADFVAGFAAGFAMRDSAATCFCACVVAADMREIACAPE
jgi:hypothetical protein